MIRTLDPDLGKVEVMKVNYEPKGETVELRCRDGAFGVESMWNPIDRLARNAKIFTLEAAADSLVKNIARHSGGSLASAWHVSARLTPRYDGAKRLFRANAAMERQATNDHKEPSRTNPESDWRAVHGANRHWSRG
jgi:hypothetical protein